MAIEWGVIQSAISAGAGLLGVWLGGRLTWAREEARENARTKKDAIYLAILVAAHLDRLADACLYVALDEGMEDGRPAGNGGCHAATVKPPTFDPLALEVNWKALSPDLMYDILGLPYRIEDLERHVWGTWEHDEPPEYTEFFWARQFGYATFGLDVSALARRLRAHAALPISPIEPDAWNRDDELRKQADKVTKEREAYQARMVARLHTSS